jgi:hypothetical protein
MLVRHTDAMDDIEELRHALEPAAPPYNEIQLRKLAFDLDLMAEFLLDLYAHETLGSDSRLPLDESQSTDRMR